MKTKLQFSLLVSSLIIHHSAFGQGSLTPPGAPAPTMKSLDQIEPRTPISSLPYTITNPGSYYVTTNLTGVSGSDGIDIATNNVTLDLNGFTLQGVAGSLNGIHVVNPARNLAIRNGALDAWGHNGVDATNSYNSQLERLCVSSNLNGFWAGSNCIVLNCTVCQSKNFGMIGLDNDTFKDCNASASGEGFGLGNNSTIIGCTAIGNGSGFSAGNNCTLKDCTASANNLGISVGNNSIIEDCTANANNTEGVLCINGYSCIIRGCTANANGSDGIVINYYSTVKDCTANANGLDGIYVEGSSSQITGNACNGNTKYGIDISGVQIRVDNNSVGNNNSYGINANSPNVGNNITRNFSPGAGYGGYPGNNDYAPIQTPTNNPASPWANF